MTPNQKDTISRIVKRIERANGKQTVSVHNILNGHITLFVGNVVDRTDFIRTTTYASCDINTKGNIVKGYADYLRPKIETKYPYM